LLPRRYTAQSFSFMSIDKKSDTGGKVLFIHFQIDAGFKWQNLKIDPMRMYVHEKLPTALQFTRFILVMLYGRVVFCMESRCAAGSGNGDKCCGF
jgi:hypothetical protein